MIVIVAMTMIVIMLMIMLERDVVIVTLVAMIFQMPLLARFLQFGFEHAPNRRIFLRFFDLFHFERNAQPLWKVTFRDGKISSDRGAGIEVLVKPEKRRRNDRTGLPVHLHGFVVFQIA